MKTRTFNFLPLLLVPLGMMAGFTACEEKGDENTLVGYWQVVQIEYADGNVEKMDDGLVVLHFWEVNNRMSYCYEEEKRFYILSDNHLRDTDNHS